MVRAGFPRVLFHLLQAPRCAPQGHNQAQRHVLPLKEAGGAGRARVLPGCELPVRYLSGR